MPPRDPEWCNRVACRNATLNRRCDNIALATIAIFGAGLIFQMIGGA